MPIILSPPFLDPDYCDNEFWGVISDVGEDTSQYGPFKYVVTKATIKHAQLGNREATVKIKVGSESEGNLYLMGFTDLSEVIGRKVKFHKREADIKGKSQKWYVICQVQEVTEKSKK